MSKTPRVFIIEGLDRLGKSTLISGLKNQLGFYQVIHYEKPQLLNKYLNPESVPAEQYGEACREALREYQVHNFTNMFKLIASGARLILDRAHLGEVVYAPMYRGYSGRYVFNLEEVFRAHTLDDVRLVLLTEDFETSKHFVDDGHSFDPTKRVSEQVLFEEAFEHSIIADKRKICITDTASGSFLPREQILQAVLQ